MKFSSDFYTTYDVEYFFVTQDKNGRDFNLGAGKVAIVSLSSYGPPEEKEFEKVFKEEFGANVIVKMVHTRREKIRMLNYG